MKAEPIEETTDAQKESALGGFFAALKKNTASGRAAVEAAVPAMNRLAEVLQGRSGQPHKLRALLYSLYNGQPTSLLEIVALDRSIREDLCAVLLGFGFESPGAAFFYKEMKAAIVEAGQWEWFIEAHTEDEK